MNARHHNPLLGTISVVAGAVTLGAAAWWIVGKRRKCMRYTGAASSICAKIPDPSLRRRCESEYGTANCKIFGIF